MSAYGFKIREKVNDITNHFHDVIRGVDNKSEAIDVAEWVIARLKHQIEELKKCRYD